MEAGTPRKKHIRSTRFTLEIHGNLKGYKLDPEVRRNIFRRICDAKYILQFGHIDDLEKTDFLLDFYHDSYRLNLHYAAIRSKNPSRQAYYISKAERFNEEAKKLENEPLSHLGVAFTEYSPITVTRST